MKIPDVMLSTIIRAVTWEDGTLELHCPVTTPGKHSRSISCQWNPFEEHDQMSVSVRELLTLLQEHAKRDHNIDPD